MANIEVKHKPTYKAELTQEEMVFLYNYLQNDLTGEENPKDNATRQVLFNSVYDALKEGSMPNG